MRVFSVIDVRRRDRGTGIIHSSKSSEAFETGFIFTNNLITSFSICVYNHSSEPLRL